MKIFLISRTTKKIVSVDIMDQKATSFTNVEVKKLTSPYYDAYFEQNGQLVPYRLSNLNVIKLLFFTRRYQSFLSNGKTLRPFTTRNKQLSFVYLTSNGMNRNLYRKQMWGYIIGKLMNIMSPFNRPNLVFEKLSERAQESGLAYFKFVIENYPREKNYFIIKKTSTDFKRIKLYRNVIIHGSFKYFYLLIRSKLFISSETPSHAYFWRENMGLTSNVVRTKPYVFLQHGVLGFKKLDSIFYGDQLTAPVRLITSSQFEQDIVTQQLEYDVERAPITGLARWDLIDLKQERTNLRDKVLLFYTWRPWLDDVDDATFVQSEYFLSIKAAIRSLKEMNLDKQIVVMMHPKMHAALDDNEILNIKLWTDEDGPLNELMSSVAVLITDYSSLSWEAYYREIPVIFDMFDQQRYEKEVGSYIDLNQVTFGNKVIKNLRDSLETVITRQYQLSEEELKNKKQYFAFEDQNASQRIHEVVKNIDLRAINRDKRRLMFRAILRIIFKK